MKTLLSLGCLALTMCAGSAGVMPLSSGGHHVLFIGNSLTYVNDLPGTVERIAELAGDTIRTRMVALPNLALIDHWNGASGAVDAIRSEPWTFVVLQEGPSALPLNRDTLILATQRFDPLIRSAGARTAELMPWPDASRLTAFDSVYASYDAAARAVSGVLFPAGRAWMIAWSYDRTLPLYGRDGFHPSELGTYLAALVVYEGVTGHDARALPPQAVANGRSLSVDEATVRLLQRAAHEAVQSSSP